VQVADTEFQDLAHRAIAHQLLGVLQQRYQKPEMRSSQPPGMQLLLWKGHWNQIKIRPQSYQQRIEQQYQCFPN
jgi:hypothetical protein